MSVMFGDRIRIEVNTLYVAQRFSFHIVYRTVYYVEYLKKINSILTKSVQLLKEEKILPYEKSF